MSTYEDVYYKLLELRRQYLILATDNSRFKSREKRYKRLAKIADILSKDVITKIGVIEDRRVAIGLSLESLAQSVGVSKQTVREDILAIQYTTELLYKFAA